MPIDSRTLTMAVTDEKLFRLSNPSSMHQENCKLIKMYRAMFMLKFYALHLSQIHSGAIRYEVTLGRC